MRNISLGGMAACCLMLVAVLVVPRMTHADEAMKFGSIDVQKVLNESEAGKKAKTALEGLIKTKQITIDDKGKTIEKLKTDLEKQASVLSAEARKNKEDELEKLVREYQRLVQDSQTEIKKKESELTETILKEIKDLVEKTGEENGYTIIFEEGMVLFSSKGIDITEAVLKKYDEAKSQPAKE